MKYIRTKDGKIWLNKNPNHDKEVYTSRYSPKDIIKEADTIEELCDRCVVIHKYGEQPKDMSFYEAQYFIDVWTRKVKSNNPIVAIYGAIWTDKGLIYVAKMNQEGEMELI